MPPKKTGYSSYLDTWKHYKTTKRISMPQVPNRPLRFQLRTILRHELITPPDPWWMTVHRTGLPRAKVGADPLEARAMPAGMIPGYLDERILYAALVNLFHFVPEVDFQYQSSQEGGRMEMGGYVCDFLFPILRIIINPTGPQHYQFRNARKDEEQIQALAERGYQVYLIDYEVIEDEYKLEDFLRRVFGGLGSPGGDPGGHPAGTATAWEGEVENYDELAQSVDTLQEALYASFA